MPFTTLKGLSFLNRGVITNWKNVSNVDLEMWHAVKNVLFVRAGSVRSRDYQIFWDG